MIFGYPRSCNPSGSNHRIIEIKKDGIISFGRDESNTIVLNHGSISRNHCLIWSVQFDQESIPTVYLRDISLNGVFVNDTRLQKVYILCDGDRIKIGNGCEFQYYPEFSEYNEKMALSPILLSNNISLELDNWIIRQKMIGKGTFGYVFASQRKSDSKLCAVKVIKNKHTSAISFEARNLPQLNHVSS